MNRTMKLAIPLGLWSILGVLGLHAAGDSTAAVDLPNARTAAIGGEHVALADDLTTLFANPAGFRSAGPQFSIAELTMGLSGPVFDIAGVMIEGASGGDPADTLAEPDVQKLLQGLYTTFRLLGPVSFGYVGNGLGFGIFNQSKLGFETQGSVPVITTLVEEDLVFAGGYAFRLPLPESWRSTLDLGTLLKAFAQGQSTYSGDLLELIDAISDPLDLIVDQPFRLTLGMGIDFGVLFTYRNRLSFGIAARDLPSLARIHQYGSMQDFLDGGSPSSSNDFLPIDLSLGIAFRPPLGRLGRYVKDLKLFLDYSDLLDFVTHPATARNPVLHAGLGAELTLLEILAVRVGFAQGLPSAGLGLDLHWFTLNLAMFGQELSSEPGLRPVYNLLIGLEFRRTGNQERGQPPAEEPSSGG